MYATHLVPTVPYGVGGSCSLAAPKRVACTPPVVTSPRQINTSFVLYFFLISCLVSGFVIGLCLDRMFDADQTGYQLRFDSSQRLDTSQVNDLRWSGTGAPCINC